MPPRGSPKSFAPTCLGALSQCGSDNADRLRLLQQHKTLNTYVPFGWGFTIYRAAFGPGSDERFATALRRLDSWVRFGVLSGRFSLLKFGREYDLLGGLNPNPSELLAERLWNEVIEEYPHKDKNRSGGEDGDEDFTPVGQAFLRWGDDLGVVLNERNARYQNCLIIDDAVLDSILDGLPEEVPEVKPRLVTGQEHQDLTRIQFRGAWVWVLDRGTVQAREAGVQRAPEDVRPPWVRIRIGDLVMLWFERLRGYIHECWWDVCLEDEVKWDRVFWWSDDAKIVNEIQRSSRAEMEANNSQSTE
jgi:hypothetical protein